jgi:hypothetical protein
VLVALEHRQALLVLPLVGLVVVLAAHNLAAVVQLALHLLAAVRVDYQRLELLEVLILEAVAVEVVTQAVAPKEAMEVLGLLSSKFLTPTRLRSHLE